MVGGDEVADDLRQVILVGQLQTLGDVADEHLGTLDVGLALVGIHARLVLGEVDGVLGLADVVIECARAYQLTLGVDLVGNLGGQVAHLNGVLEGARRHLAHAAQQLLVHVGELDERDVRREVEGLLHDVEQGVRAEQQQAVEQQVVELAVVDGRDVVVAYPEERQIDEHGGTRDEGGRPE